MNRNAHRGALQPFFAYAVSTLAAAALTLAAGNFLANPNLEKLEAKRAPRSELRRLSMRILQPSGVLRTAQPFTQVREEERRPAPGARTEQPPLAAPEENPPADQVAAATAPDASAPTGLHGAVQPSASNLPAAYSIPLRILPPAPLGDIRPVYPAQARRRGLEGLARVRVLIGADGRPREAELQTSSGYSLLDQAALSAVLAAAYRPAESDGRPASGELVVPVRFVLVDR